MKQLFALMAVAFAATAHAHGPFTYGIENAEHLSNNTPLSVERHLLGSGEQNFGGFEPAVSVLPNDIFHAPQYLPYHPTAATIYPRVIQIDCKVDMNDPRYPRAHHSTPYRHVMRECEGYDWVPAMGRAEYLFVTPHPAPAPEVIVKEVPGPERIILKEVPVKKKRE